MKPHAVLIETLRPTILDGVDSLDESPPPQFVSGGKVALYHYTRRDQGDAYLVDPIKAKKHRGSYSRREFQTSATPRLFFYLDPSDKEAGVGEHLYIVDYSAKRIYNLLEDSLHLKERARRAPAFLDFDLLFKLVLAAGFDGVYYRPGFHVVSLLVPTKLWKVEEPARLAASRERKPMGILVEIATRRRQ